MMRFTNASRRDSPASRHGAGSTTIPRQAPSRASTPPERSTPSSTRSWAPFPSGGPKPSESLGGLTGDEHRGGVRPMKGYRGALVLGILCGGLIMGGALLHRGFAPAAPSVDGAHLFEQVVKLVEKNYIDSVPAAELYRRAVDGMLEELGDPHTAYLAPRRLDRLTESTTGNYPGLGIEVDARSEGITVVAPIPGGPAEAAGIRTGDRIIAVEGVSTRSWTVEEAARAVRGKPGTS